MGQSIYKPWFVEQLLQSNYSPSFMNKEQSRCLAYHGLPWSTREAHENTSSYQERDHRTHMGPSI